MIYQYLIDLGLTATYAGIGSYLIGGILLVAMLKTFTSCLHKYI